MRLPGFSGNNDKAIKETGWEQLTTKKQQVSCIEIDRPNRLIDLINYQVTGCRKILKNPNYFGLFMYASIFSADCKLLHPLDIFACFSVDAYQLSFIYK